MGNNNSRVKLHFDTNNEILINTLKSFCNFRGYNLLINSPEQIFIINKYDKTRKLIQNSILSTEYHTLLNHHSKIIQDCEYNEICRMDHPTSSPKYDIIKYYNFESTKYYKKKYDEVNIRLSILEAYFGTIKGMIYVDEVSHIPSQFESLEGQ